MKNRYYQTLLAYIKGKCVDITLIFPYIFKQNLESLNFIN